MHKHLRFDIFELQETKLPAELINTTNEQRLVLGHETLLSVQGYSEDVSSALDNGVKGCTSSLKCPELYYSRDLCRGAKKCFVCLFLDDGVIDLSVILPLTLLGNLWANNSRYSQPTLRTKKIVIFKQRRSYRRISSINDAGPPSYWGPNMCNYSTTNKIFTSKKGRQRSFDTRPTHN
ncbi:hypothetical protein TNCV_4257601 [Trichonephila clavipes]|nr:hypothetical protein TNCV_4257601 [Trichonephila clavipes]